MRTSATSPVGTFRTCNDLSYLVANGGETDIPSDRGDFAF